jgi:hypothetical protein
MTLMSVEAGEIVIRNAVLNALATVESVQEKH